MNAIQETLTIRPYSSFDYKYIYTPRWASKEEFQEIIISRSMVMDHLDIFGLLTNLQIMMKIPRCMSIPE
jgi:hypothetical protein